VGDTNTIYRTLKELSAKNQQRRPIKPVDGKRASTILDAQQIKRWQQYFTTVVNCHEPDIKRF